MNKKITKLTDAKINLEVDRQEEELPSPALYVNQFTVTETEMIRIAFSEQLVTDGKLFPRSTIILTRASAICLGKLLEGALSADELSSSPLN